jgi:hypothetical protein
MPQSYNSLETILTQKKDLLRLFVIAALLAFSVGVLASMLAARTILPTWATATIAILLICLSLALLAADIRSSLTFQDRLDAVLFIHPGRNELIAVTDYEFSEDLHRTLSAVKAENQSIYADWDRDPLVPVMPDRQPSGQIDRDSKSKPQYVALFKAPVPDTAKLRPRAVRLLEEAAAFVLLEHLSLHLSDYFNGADGDDYISTYSREDIPGFLLQNRVVNLLSTPIEQRDVFLDAFPDKETRPSGQLYSLYGTNGTMYSKFELVLPKGTVIRHSEAGAIRIETRRLAIELRSSYHGSGTFISEAFLKQYIGEVPKEIVCRTFQVWLTGKIRPLSLITSAGWEYYRWLDSFREAIRSKCDFETFQQDIHWDVIEPLLHSLRGRDQFSRPAESKDGSKDGGG